MKTACRAALVALLLGWVVSPCGGATPDPAVRFATLLGIADCDGIAAWNGDAFLACHSPGDRLPIEVRNPAPLPNVMSAYVLRVNVNTGKLVYATRLAATEFTAAFRIKVDRNGYAYAAGFTKARDFQTTPDAVQSSFGGGDSDGFLVKLNPAGRVVYATLLGGDGADQANGLELDADGGVFVGGTTWSSGFPGQSTPRLAEGGDAFVSYLRPGSPASLRSVVFGGALDEKLTGLAADHTGGLFAVGYTKSKDFPVFKPIQGNLRGVSDVFLIRLQKRDLKVSFSTYFGGSGDDSGWGVAVDGAGDPVVAGITNSSDLPASANAYQRTAQGGLDAFVAKFEGPEYRTVRLTYFGGTKDDSSGYDGDDIKIDSAGNVWVVGLTGSPDLPMRHAAQPVYGGGEVDGFLAAFSADLDRLCYATYWGGSDRDLLEGVVLSADGTVLATGLTFSKDLTIFVHPVQRILSTVRVAEKIVNETMLGLRVAHPCR